MRRANRVFGTVGRSGIRVAAAHRATPQVVVNVLRLAEHVHVESGLSYQMRLQSEVEGVSSSVFVRAHR
jgi:hypothetical protein